MKDRRSVFQQLWLRCLLIFGVWTAIGLVDAGQSYFLRATSNNPTPLVSCLLLGVSDYYVWALFTPLIWWMAERFPLEPGKWHWRLCLHIAASLLTSLAVIAVEVPVMQAIPHALTRPLSDRELFHLLFAHKLVFYVLIHWMILGVSHGLYYYRKYQAGELQASQLETELAHAQLQMLRMQVQPHFLFNTLNAISALLHQDVELADRMLAHLGELLRQTLKNPGGQEVSLGQELDFLHSYLEIEQARLGPRLSVRLDIDPATVDASVPSFLLQPLVENAIRHGVAPRPGTGRVEIRSWREEGRLRLEVSDTGPGLPEEPLKGLKEGVGLSNTRARLHHLYGNAHALELHNGPHGGLAVAVSIPFHPQDQAPTGNGRKPHVDPHPDC
jgi:signal transduction histidine kinase